MSSELRQSVNRDTRQGSISAQVSSPFSLRVNGTSVIISYCLNEDNDSIKMESSIPIFHGEDDQDLHTWFLAFEKTTKRSSSSLRTRFPVLWECLSSELQEMLESRGDTNYTNVKKNLYATFYPPHQLFDLLATVRNLKRRSNETADGFYKRLTLLVSKVAACQFGSANPITVDIVEQGNILLKGYSETIYKAAFGKMPADPRAALQFIKDYEAFHGTVAPPFKPHLKQESYVPKHQKQNQNPKTFEKSKPKKYCIHHKSHFHDTSECKGLNLNKPKVLKTELDPTRNPAKAEKPVSSTDKNDYKVNSVSTHVTDIRIPVEMQGKQFTALIDTGASINVMSESVANLINAPKTATTASITTANNQKQKVLYSTTIMCKFPTFAPSKGFLLNFLVIPSLPGHMLLGMEGLTSIGFGMDLETPGIKIAGIFKPLISPPVLSTPTSETMVADPDNYIFLAQPNTNNQLADIFQSFPSVVDTTKLGNCSILRHEIHLTNTTTPIYSRPYRIPEGTSCRFNPTRYHR
jgi:predicted aspartyl protease